MPNITQRQPLPATLPKPRRVAAYCRVTTGKDAMLHSLSAQVSHYSQRIQSTPGWVYAGVYADEALTGTKQNRPQFQRLLADCRAGKVDLIVTKSVSRFARNTVTTLETVRELRALGVDVYFEEQNIHTLTAEGELLLTLLASYAQEESFSVSENCKWRIRNDFKQGRATFTRLLGYEWCDGKFVIVSGEVELVQQIFADYLSGMGLLKLQKKLLADGIYITQNGLRGMLRNEKYTGDLLLQKTFIADHLTKEKRKNNGELPQYLVTDAHEAIIDRVTFSAVQAELAKRTARHRQHPPETTPFSGIIKCGICGASFRRKHAAAGSKYEKIVWICSTFNTLGKAHCNSQQVPEDILLAKVAEVGGFDGLQEIRVPGAGQLSFIYEGKTVDLAWQHRSRREIWTPAMRQVARQRELNRRAVQ
ncbi:MAG: recombinase family protein [Oscillospiraceae bacterium]|nr:recombinase family protein [Oscillospiraceae bacterium]